MIMNICRWSFAALLIGVASGCDPRIGGPQIVPDAPPSLPNDPSCEYGEFGCNSCITDVPAAFARASGSINLRHGFNFEPSSTSLNGMQPDAFHIKDHIQGISRVSGVGQENWVALSRNARDKGDAAVYLVPFDQISSNGDAWKYAARPSDSTARGYYYHRIPGFNHAGGMQALGPMLFVATDCDEGESCDAAVHIYDTREPDALPVVSSLVLDGSQGELNRNGTVVSSRAAAVAATQLPSGRYLLFIRGRENDENGWFFLSDSSFISSGTRWIFQNHWHRSDLPEGTEWHSWEAVNFVNDCDNGGVYLVAMGTDTNKSYLYRVEDSGLLPFNFAHLSGRGLSTSGPRTSTRFGAGIHVTPGGDIVSYVTQRQPTLEIEEFRYHGEHED